MNSNVLAFSYLPAKILLHCSWAFAPSGEQPERLKNIKGDCEQRQIQISLLDSTAWFRLRACFRIAWGPAARDFGCGQGGEAGASPKRAVTGEPTRATAKRTAARRVFAEKAAWLRCSSVTDPSWVCSLVAPRHSAFSAKTGPHGILKQALSDWS